MKIHLRQIPVGGLHLEGEEDCPLADVAEVRCSGPLRYNFEAGVSEGALWVNGSLRQEVELTCVACLEKFKTEIRVPEFAIHEELAGPETVDLTPFAREDLLLNLPAYPHCDRDGGRVCPGPKLAPSEQKSAALEKRAHDWGELDKLDL